MVTISLQVSYQMWRTFYKVSEPHNTLSVSFEEMLKVL